MNLRGRGFLLISGDSAVLMAGGINRNSHKLRLNLAFDYGKAQAQYQLNRLRGTRK